MWWLIVCLAVTSAAAFEINGRYERELCAAVECRAGRECEVSGGVATCRCVQSCPDRYAPVCGSDGVTYDTHCLLHRQACLTGEHIQVRHKGVCKKVKQVKQKAKPAKQEVKKEDPAVCYSSQRDAMLAVVRHHWEDTLASQPWHVAGMTYREGLWGRFFTCDSDRNNFLVSDELLNCTSGARFVARPDQDSELTRALCVDAVVDMGDSNRDWQLDFEEFTTVFSPTFRPPQKQCSLDGKKYQDGEEVNVDGSHCVCAVGSWVCTSPTQSSSQHDSDSKFDSLAFNYLDYDDEDDEDEDYFLEDDEDILINEDEDEDYIQDLFEDLLGKLRDHRRKKQHHHNHL